jgi:hypothetical protein
VSQSWPVLNAIAIYVAARGDTVLEACVKDSLPSSVGTQLGIIITITMAQQPYMGSGLLLPPLFEVTKSCAFVAVGDWPTGRATILSILKCPPEPSGRQSAD